MNRLVELRHELLHGLINGRCWISFESCRASGDGRRRATVSAHRLVVQLQSLTRLSFALRDLCETERAPRLRCRQRPFVVQGGAELAFGVGELILFTECARQ